MVSPPENVNIVLSLLKNAGYRALLVGGCVRDILRGKTPHDWDITTSATPEEMLEVFADLRLAPVSSGGMKHGTVTVILDHEPIEVTTFRLDGEYSDGRRPDSVGFSRKLEDDLSRRDFTINALCIDEQGEIVDMFGGRDDLKNGVIKAIGDPDKRFCEDALRIIRALRFAASFGFDIEKNTAESMLRNYKRLDLVASERISDELIKLICAPDCLRVMTEYKTLICEIIPELKPMVGMFQRSDYHCYDVFDHTIHALAAAPNEPVLRLAMLLHDVGKPACADGQGHFHRHESVGAQLAKEILKRFNCKKQTRDRIVSLIFRHSLPVYTDKIKIKKQLAKYGDSFLLQLLQVKRADTMAQNPAIAAERLKFLDEVQAAVQKEIESRPAVSLSQLAVKGGDIISLGVEPGPEVGKLLSELLSLVIEEKLPNEREKLLEYTIKKLNR